MSWIPGGTFSMGSNDHYPEEAPAHPVTVDGFWIDQYTVTNAQFSRFVEQTNYVTSAERAPRAEDYPSDCRPDLVEYVLENKDQLLLCTDGLTDLVDDTEIESILTEEDSAQSACRKLVDLALRNGGRDNVTVIVARYSIPQA
jgi:serine/threonine protein phosphatase PrpC